MKVTKKKKIPQKIKPKVKAVKKPVLKAAALRQNKAKPALGFNAPPASSEAVIEKPKTLDTIAVLDFGGQYAHLIANRIRRMGVFSEIREGDTPASELWKYKGIILSGGPGSVYEKNAPMCDPEILRLGVPILGICYGHQLLVHLLGGKVEPEKSREYGMATLNISRNVGPLKFLGDMTKVWMSHGDSVTQLPVGMEVIATTESCGYAAVADEYKKIFGIQFHPEVTHTQQGTKILENFIELCGAEKDWNLKNYVEKLYDKIRQQTRNRKVFCLVSGGVDSTVTFALLEKALSPQRVHGLFVDTGLLRDQEAERVQNSLKKMGFKVLFYDARKEFYKALSGITAPEKKRQIIGDTFLEVQKKVSKELKLNTNDWMLGQGTIYPDTIESGGTKNAVKIKTHHNRVPQIDALIKKGLLIEPLKDLYKDEVRSVGEKLGIDKDMIWRHPFPGPGLGVRCLCAKKPSLPGAAKNIEKKIAGLLSQHDLKGKLLPIQSVGVQGDGRSYKNPVVVSGDASWEVLQQVATQIPNQIKEVNRVVYGAAPGEVTSVEFVPAMLTPDRIQLLQKADALVMKFVEQKGLMKQIWQFPVVLIPVSFNKKAGETIVLRPVCSEEAMTASPYFMDWALLRKLSDELMKIPGISAVMYDVTTKPPGTIEWE